MMKLIASNPAIVPLKFSDDVSADESSPFSTLGHEVFGNFGDSWEIFGTESEGR